MCYIIYNILYTVHVRIHGILLLQIGTVYCCIHWSYLSMTVESTVSIRLSLDSHTNETVTIIRIKQDKELMTEQGHRQIYHRENYCQVTVVVCVGGAYLSAMSGCDELNV